MEDNKLREPDLLKAEEGMLEVTGEEEDFEQIEDSLWEEYFREDVSNSGMNPEQSLVRTRMEDKGTAQVVFAFTNIFSWILIFCGWHISISFLVGSCIFVGFLMISILMCQACTTAYDENHIFMQGLLLYFPVKKKSLRRELYLLLWKYIGIQAGIICVPLLMNMCIAFYPDYFLITLGTMILSMLTMGILIIEGSMSRLKAKD